MNLSITGNHLEITASLKDFIKEKMNKIEHHFDKIIDAKITLSVNKLQHKAECTVHVSGANMRAESTNEDMYVAIENLVQKLDRQVIKHKEKQKKHR
ncbi:MAG: ribosome-associated translation inhibitor RaiA [Gammaproteobacteria bacterium]|nr:MAG: ribosome-associated translation inhibitor RaiA [Gammaproteobacteria bacterium]